MRGGQGSPKNEVSSSGSIALGRAKMSVVAGWPVVEAPLWILGQNHTGGKLLLSGLLAA